MVVVVVEHGGFWWKRFMGSGSCVGYEQSENVLIML